MGYDYIDESHVPSLLLWVGLQFVVSGFIFSTWGMPGFSEQEIRTYLPHLKCVFYAAGSVQDFARPFLNCGVSVFSAWAANAVPVAEYTVAQIILANKDFFCQTRLLAQKRRDEAERRRTLHIGNFRKKVGLIGCGMIGSMVATMLQNYDLEVLVYDPFLSEEKKRRLKVTPCTLDELFSSCSVVSNHLANNGATRKMQAAQACHVNPQAAEDICARLEMLCKSEKMS